MTTQTRVGYATVHTLTSDYKQKLFSIEKGVTISTFFRNKMKQKEFCDHFERFVPEIHTAQKNKIGGSVWKSIDAALVRAMEDSVIKDCLLREFRILGKQRIVVGEMQSFRGLTIPDFLKFV